LIEDHYDIEEKEVKNLYVGSCGSRVVLRIFLAFGVYGNANSTILANFRISK